LNFSNLLNYHNNVWGHLRSKQSTWAYLRGHGHKYGVPIPSAPPTTNIRLENPPAGLDFDLCIICATNFVMWADAVSEASTSTEPDAVPAPKSAQSVGKFRSQDEHPDKDLNQDLYHEMKFNDTREN